MLVPIMIPNLTPELAGRIQTQMNNEKVTYAVTDVSYENNVAEVVLYTIDSEGHEMIVLRTFTHLQSVPSRHEKVVQIDFFQ